MYLVCVCFPVELILLYLSAVFLVGSRSVTYELGMAYISSSKYSVVSYIALVSRLHIFWIHLGYFPFPFLFCRMLTIIPSNSIEYYWNFCYQQNNFFFSRFYLFMSLHHLSVCVLCLTLTRYLKKK